MISFKSPRVQISSFVPESGRRAMTVEYIIFVFCSPSFVRLKEASIACATAFATVICARTMQPEEYKAADAREVLEMGIPARARSTRRWNLNAIIFVCASPLISHRGRVAQLAEQLTLNQ